MRLKPIFSIFGISLFISLVVGSYLTYSQLNQATIQNSKPELPKVLGMSAGGWGRTARPPQLQVYGGDSSMASGGIISMSTTDQPTITLSSYNVSGNAKSSLYRADLASLLKYLEHDSENLQLNKQVDTNSFTFVADTTHSISGEGITTISLPLEGKGIWYLTVEIGGIKVDGFIIRSDSGVVAKEGDGEFIFWGQDFETKKSISSGNLTLYSLKDRREELATSEISRDGIAKSPLRKDADIAIYKDGDDIALIPLNLQYLNVGAGYTPYAKAPVDNRYFLFTDRPIYLPGDTVNFKAIIRRDDDAEYSVSKGDAKVTIKSGTDVTVYEETLAINEEGSLSGSFKIKDDAQIGTYNLSVQIGPKIDEYFYGEYSPNNTYFQVQHYQKPESFISVDSDKIEYISGDKVKLKIGGTYFSGQPQLGAQIKYRVSAIDYSEYTYFNDYSNYLKQNINSLYDYLYGTQLVTEGVVTLDERGESSVEIDTVQIESPDEYSGYTKGKSKIFIVEVTQEDGSLTPSFNRKNFIVYAGDYGIYQNDSNYSTKVGQEYRLNLKLAPYFRPVELTGVNLKTKLTRETWVKKLDSNSKYPKYESEVEDLGEYNVKTGKNNEATFNFTPKRVGYYTLQVSGEDSIGNYIAKNFYIYVSDREMPIFSGEISPEISITLDKENYLPGDTVQATITSEIEDRDVLLTIERGRTRRYQIETLSGKSSTIQLPLEASDIPNVFLIASSFNDYDLDLAQVNIPVSPESKKIILDIAPDSTKYGPGSNIEINLTTTDLSGNPVPAEVALWTVDKAIYELAGNVLGNIYSTFWGQRGDTTSESHSLQGILSQQAEGGGCFAGDTQILMANGETKSIDQVKVGDYIFTRNSDNSDQVTAKVTGLHSNKVDGFIIINDALRLTPDHILRVNDLWLTAGDISVGDTLTSQSGESITVQSIAYQLGEFQSFNLEIDKYHTFIAGGVWVHNQKGDARTVFKDTAYWNPSIKTDKNGKASVKFKLPDNLTTWTLSGVATTRETEVGQSTKEIVVAKDIVVRPILPNIMRVGDDLYLSALIQNFTDSQHTFDIQLEFDSGEVVNNTWENVIIPAHDMEQLSWQIKPNKLNDAANLKITAKTENAKLSDSITTQIPVRPFGYLETTAQVGVSDESYNLALDSSIDLERSSATLSLSPSLLGTLPTVMEYLVDYSYGCVEQTVSRLVPSLILGDNKSLITKSLMNKNLDKVVAKSISRLTEMQRSDGGWTWWYTGKSSPFITAYVLENLAKAESQGYEIDSSVIERAQSYLSNISNEADNNRQLLKIDDLVSMNYGLLMSGKTAGLVPIGLIDNLDPDLLAMVVIYNSKLGDKNPSSNGLKLLSSLAQSQGEGVFWSAGSKERFGSVEASTALAVKALIEAGGDKDLIDRAVLYLARGRKAEYWANTYSTSRVLSSLIDYSNISNDQNPSYSYLVNLAGKKISSGNVDSAKTLIEDLDIPLSKIGSEPQVLDLSMSGDGNLYSTFKLAQFITSKDIKAQNRGISITKRFENVKGAEYGLGVGDTANVILSVSGLSVDDKYGVIVDELPSGLVPVNTALKNQESSWYIPENFESSYDITDTEVSENGVVLSLYNVSSGEREYSYKARVVSAGSFLVPPATISLMYSPEVYGRSSSNTIKIEPTMGTSNGNLTNKFIWPVKIIMIALALALVVVLAIFLRKRYLKKSQVPEAPVLPQTEPPKPTVNEL